MKKVSGRRFILALLLCVMFVNVSEGRKYKITHTIEKDSDEKRKKKKGFEGTKVEMTDTLSKAYMDFVAEDPEILKVRFAGFDKEPNSSMESFMLQNPSGNTITGFEVRVDYLDMQGRMLHSRTIKESCDVPPGETRRFDIKSWDTQHTYYYYLGNAPKKVATPFQVIFYPVTFWIKKER